MVKKNCFGYTPFRHVTNKFDCLHYTSLAQASLHAGLLSIYIISYIIEFELLGHWLHLLISSYQDFIHQILFSESTDVKQETKTSSLV